MSYVASQHIQELLLAFFNYKDALLNGVQEKESIIRVRTVYKNPSLMVTDWHHSASLVMPIGDPRNGFSIPTSHS